MRSDRYLKPENEEQKKNEPPKNKKEKFNKKYIIAIILLIFLVLFINARFLCPKSFIVKEYKIENSLIDESFNGFKIVHFSDIHYGTSIGEKELKKIVTEINNLKPDIVVFTGDLTDKDVKIKDSSIDFLKDQLKSIEARYYKYAVIGDEEIDEYYDILDDADFIMLDNQTRLLFNNGNYPIVIAGFSNNVDDYDLLSNEEYNDFYKIALVHKPDEANKIADADLVLAGHSMGGIIKIGTPLIKFDGAKKVYKDHSFINNKEVFISYGLGTSKANIRFNNKPSINLYRLYKK